MRKNIKIFFRRIRLFFLKHPSIRKFFRKRLTADETFGLHLTIGIIVVFLCIVLFFDVLSDVLRQDPLIQYDINLINLVQVVHTKSFTQIMLFVTYLSQWQIILLGVCAVSIFLAGIRQWHTIVVLLISTGVGELLVLLTKLLIKRPRPILVNALLSESGFSFPSGHSFIAVSFYGLLTYLLIQHTRRRLLRCFIFCIGAIIIGAIGLSRIYLGVHWPSDVLASYLLGSAWLAILVTILEIRKRSRFARAKSFLVRRSFLPILGFTLFVFWLWNASYFYFANPIIPSGIISQKPSHIKAVEFPTVLFEESSRHSEDITGEPTEPIDLIVVGDEASLDAVFQAAQWFRSDPIIPQTIMRAVVRLLSAQPYPEAPSIPTYWNHEANDFSYVQEARDDNPQSRHHVHIWQTPFLYEGTVPVWFGTAHFDMAVKFKSALFIPTHTTDRFIDKERDRIRDAFQKTGLISEMRTYQIVEPTSGENIVGDHFYTDGMAYIFFLRGAKW